VLELESRLLPSINVLTYHDDIIRSGLDPNETVLTPSNVNSTAFGKLFVDTVDGKVDAEPLYKASITIPGKGTHNVVFVCTEHDSVYAWDADSNQGSDATPLWQVSLLPSGEMPSDPRGCSQVTPEIGITATPVINNATNIMYVVAMSKDSSGNYYQRLHALNITTGADQLTPVVIKATYTDPVTGVVDTFDPAQYKERSALLLLNGNVYLSFASHCDITPYQGWVMSYKASTLGQISVLDITPNGSEGAFWNAGAGPAADSSGNFYNLAGNGTFDTTLNGQGFPNQDDFGNLFLKFSPTGGVHVNDYFAPYNTVSESNSDTDLGSGGVIVLPTMRDSSGNLRYLVIGAGKDGNIYLADRTNMGKFNPSNNNNLYQELAGALSGGEWATSAYFNGAVYFGPVSNHLMRYTFSHALLNSSPASQTGTTFGYPGTTPSISSNGSKTGIVWAAENGDVAVLHAYDALNLATELYNSNQAPNDRDHFGTGNKFITPMIANGKVYVATTTGIGVFGLLSGTADPPAAGDNGAWLSQVYIDLLNRPIDSAGLDGWTASLSQGATRTQVVLALEASPEYLTAVVQGYYQRYLHRNADAIGLNSWVAFLEAGGTKEQVQAGIAGSGEYFQNRGGGTAAGFLTALYQDGLGRAVDSAGLATFSSALASGATPGQVAAVIFASEEYLQDQIQADYLEFLNRPADAFGLASFNAQRLAGLSDQAVIAAIVASGEYMGFPANS
jgi:hypothetical protein